MDNRSDKGNNKVSRRGQARNIPMLGKKFGKLTVLERANGLRNGRYWRCECECGHSKVVFGNELRRGSTWHCGCSNKAVIDLVGRRYNRLLVLGRDLEKERESKKRKVWWKCACDCGNLKTICSSDLTWKHIQSCGCFLRDTRGQSTLKHGLARVGAKTLEYTMWAHAKKRARDRNIPFDIKPEDIVIPDKCPIFGTPLRSSKGNGGKMTSNSPSLDRTIGELGYVKSNISVISRRANTIKNDASSEELRAIANYIDKQTKEAA